MIRFPITDLLNQQECYDYLVRTLHPAGLCCYNHHPLPTAQAPHDRRRAPLYDYRCRVCGNVFNLLTDTAWEGAHYDCVTIVLVMRGFAQGIPTLQLADELELDYGTLLERRHQIQQLALDHQPATALPDPVTEADEMRWHEMRAKKARNTTIRMTRRGVALTIDLGPARWTMTARPF